MTDRDTITLPREVVQEALEALEFAERNHDGEQSLYTQEITALRTALAAPVQPRCDGNHSGPRCDDPECWNDATAHLAAEQPKPEPVATVGTQSNAAWKGYDGRWSPPGDPIKVVHLLRDLPLGTLLYTAPPDAEALRRDAERYRYLRNRDPKEVFNKSGKAAGVWIDWEDDLSGLQLLTGDDADAAIDAAMGDKR